MKNKLKGFSDYADFEGYADLMLHQSTAWNTRLYNYLQKKQKIVDPVTEIRKLNVILRLCHFGAEFYKKTEGKDSFNKALKARNELPADLKFLLLECA
jgi:hypothetical protein